MYETDKSSLVLKASDDAVVFEMVMRDEKIDRLRGLAIGETPKRSLAAYEGS